MDFLNPNLAPIGSHTVKTMAASAVFSPADMPSNATHLMVQALTQHARFTLDGSNPSATVGFQLKTTDEPLLIPLSAHTYPNFFPETAGTVLQYQWMGSRSG